MKVALLITLMFGHYIGDYTHLSTKWMLDAKRVGKPIEPILAHAMMHCLLVWFILSLFGSSNPGLVLVELITHFIIDVLKGKCNVWFPAVSNPANKSHWYIFGFDQFLHHVVLVVIWAAAVGI